MNKAYNWYSQLIKPTWSPPSWLFGPVWSVLYVLIAISFGKVFILAFQKKVSFLILLPFILNLIFNFAFTPLQFGLKNNLLALHLSEACINEVFAQLNFDPHLRAENLSLAQYAKLTDALEDVREKTT